MPRGEPGIYTAVRLKPGGRKWLDDLLAETSAPDLTTVVKAALNVARRHEQEVKLLIQEKAEEA